MRFMWKGVAIVGMWASVVIIALFADASGGLIISLAILALFGTFAVA